MGQNIDIGTISGMTVEEILTMMKSKGIGESSGGSNTTIASLWGASCTLATTHKTLVPSNNMSDFVLLANEDIELQGTNGYAKRLREKATVSSSGASYEMYFKVVFTNNTGTYTSPIVKGYNTSHTAELTIDSDIFGTIKGNIKVYGKFISSGTTNTGVWFGNIYADVYN